MVSPVPRHTPVVAHLELTLQCNLDCLHCYLEETVPESAKELTTAEWLKVFHDLRELGTLVLVFTGGEIFLRRDTLYLAEEARKMGFAIVFFSNGTVISDSDIERLMHIAPLSIDISLHGTSAMEQDRISGVEGSYDAIICTLTKLKQAGIPIRIKTSLIRANGGNYAAFISLAEQMGARLVTDPYIFPKRDGNCIAENQRLEKESLARILTEKQLKRKAAVKQAAIINSENRPLCGTAGSATIVISSDGTVYPCIPMRKPIGSVKKTELGTIWNGSPVLLELRGLKRSDQSVCQPCADKEHCFRCPALAFSETGDWLSCTRFAKTLNETRLLIARNEAIYG